MSFTHLLAATVVDASPGAGVAARDDAAMADAVGPALGPALTLTVELGIALLVVGMVLCLYRVLRGPELADRVLAADVLALHVVGLVVALAIYLGTTAFLDVALVVAIIGFASTLAFAQYIAATGGREGRQNW
ncbi:MAG: monovalent cation/H+ antiporter complex subunit F [Phycisphaeraceae bacterium]